MADFRFPSSRNGTARRCRAVFVFDLENIVEFVGESECGAFRK